MESEYQTAKSSINGLGFIEIRDNVFFAKDEQVTSCEILISSLKVIASHHPSGRARVCFHNNLSAKVQEMLIVFANKMDLTPLKQEKETTLTYVVISGKADLLQFNDQGIVIANKAMGHSIGRSPVEKISSKIIRTINVISDYFVFYEITEGPFEDNDTLYFENFINIKNIKLENVNQSEKMRDSLYKSLDYDVRPVNIGDFELLEKLHFESMKPHIEKIYGWCLAKQKKIFLERFSLKNHYAVFDGENLVGRVKYMEINGHYYLDIIEISDKYRNKGIGGRLIDSFFGNKEINLQVYRDSPAINFYQNCGFIMITKTENHIHLKRAAIG